MKRQDVSAAGYIDGGALEIAGHAHAHVGVGQAMAVWLRRGSQGAGEMSAWHRKGVMSGILLNKGGSVEGSRRVEVLGQCGEWRE